MKTIAAGAFTMRVEANYSERENTHQRLAKRAVLPCWACRQSASRMKAPHYLLGVIEVLELGTGYFLVYRVIHFSGEGRDSC